MTASPVILTTRIKVLTDLNKTIEFTLMPHLHECIVSKMLEHHRWDVHDWYPTYSLYDMSAEWSSEEIDYLKIVTEMREAYYHQGFDSVADYDIPFGMLNYSQRNEISPTIAEKKSEIAESVDIRQGLALHEPYPTSYYSDVVKAKAYVNRVLYRRVQDFSAIAKSLLSHAKRKRKQVSVYLPGDGCGLGAFVFSSYGFRVVSEEPSQTMRELQADVEIRTQAREALASVAHQTVISKADEYTWDSVKPGVFRYDVAVDYFVMSHIKDYVAIDYGRIKAKWVSFEHRIFDMPSYHSTVYAPNGSIKTSHPGMISYPLTISDRIVVQYPVIFKEVFCRYKTFRLYEGTKGEYDYMEAYNTMRKFRYVTSEVEEPVLHIVRNTEIQGFKSSDAIWHVLVGKEITLPVAKTMTSLLNNEERRLAGIPYEFHMTPFLGYEFQFLPPSGRLYDVEGKEIVSEPLINADPTGIRYVRIKDRTVYRFLHGRTSSILVSRFVKLDYRDVTFDQWLAHVEDYPMPYSPTAFMLDGIIYSTEMLDTQRRFVQVQYDVPRFLQAVNCGDIDEIREIVAGYSLN